MGHKDMKKIFAPILNSIFPPVCALCKADTDSNGNLCVDCWKSVRFITRPYCVQCANPLDMSLSEQEICGQCVNNPPAFQQSRSLFHYDDTSKKLIFKLKFYDKLYIAKHAARWLYTHYADYINQADIVTGIPMHRKKLRKRTYNQSTLLAACLAKMMDKVCFIPDLVIKTKWTESQSSLTLNKRHQNMKNVFQLNPRYSLADKIILVVDDVMTTGATLQECSVALSKSNPREIRTLTVAKTCL